jgi:hypothetical protein
MAKLLTLREAESGATWQQAIRETQNRAGPRFKLGAQGLEAMWEVPNLCRAGLQPCRKVSIINAALQAAEKLPTPFCHSEQSEESLFLFIRRS